MRSVIADYDKVIRLQPDYTAAYLIRGAAYAYLGRYEKAPSLIWRPHWSWRR